jgi:hypothetical protein
MVYPRNNFATDAKYWGREVEKKITNLESSLQSSDINNTTRDSQLSVTSNQALIAANDAKDAAAAAQVAADEALIAFNTANAASSAAATAAAAASDANAEALDALQKIIQLGSPGGPTINASNLTAGTINGVSITGTNITGGSISGTSISGGSIAALNSLDVPFGHIFGASISSAGELSTQTTLRRDELNGGGTTGASFSSGGFLIRSASSARYKTDIEDAEFSLEAVLQLQPKTFRLKEEVAEDSENALVYPGFIAEDIAGTALDVFVNYETLPDGTRRPDGVRYGELTSALVSAIKQQNETIKTLEARLDALEAE